MTAFRDQSYLLNKQYKDASNFNARVALHARFSVNKHGWHNWVFNQFTLSTEHNSGAGLWTRLALV